jgi:hypothetical protein
MESKAYMGFSEQDSGTNLKVLRMERHSCGGCCIFNFGGNFEGIKPLNTHKKKRLHVFSQE